MVDNSKKIPIRTLQIKVANPEYQKLKQRKEEKNLKWLDVIRKGVKSLD